MGYASSSRIVLLQAGIEGQYQTFALKACQSVSRAPLAVFSTNAHELKISLFVVSDSL
jgi:hypothetical protein